MKNALHFAVLAAWVVLIAACGSKKSLMAGDGQSAKSSELTRQQLLKQVMDNEVYATNIVGDVSLTLKMGDKSVTLPGSLRMRKGEVVRLQVLMPLLGTEVGRLEFTPDYVLVLDRMHKQYAKGDYNQLHFLRNNGLTFYSLQSLFWNQLFLPGEKKLAEKSLDKFSVDFDAPGITVPVSHAKGNMSYVWDVTRAGQQIQKTTVSYQATASLPSTLLWNYGGFKAVGVKQFPAQQSFTFTTTSPEGKVVTATIGFRLNNISTDSKWEAQTSLSPKYKEVEADSLLRMIMGAQGGLDF